FFSETDTLGIVQVSGNVTPDVAAAFATLRTDRDATVDIDRYRRYFDKPVDHSLLLTIDAHDLPFVSRQLMLLDSAYFAPVGSTVDLLVDLSNPGRWMLHCHIAEHLSAGMMMGFTVGN